MSLLVTVLEHARATSTHHRLALDALMHLGGPDAAGWRDMYLYHNEGFLEGAKAPDKAFKDFKNHVLHVNENYWGGAVAATCLWYDKLVASLSEHAWEAAAYAAGVMSHYYTDVWCPLHTGSSEKEGAVHRAFEWSVCKSYDDLRQRASARGAGGVTVPVGERWLEEMVAGAAVISNRFYDEMIDQYDLAAGSVDPPAGLNEAVRERLADLLGRAASGLARILERASDEAGVSPPLLSLTWPTVLASVKLPIHRILAKIEDADERAAIKAIYGEWQESGRVTRYLPEECHIVRLQKIEESLRRPVAPTETPVLDERLAARPSPRVANPVSVRRDEPTAPLRENAIPRPETVRPERSNRRSAAIAPQESASEPHVATVAERFGRAAPTASPSVGLTAKPKTAGRTATTPTSAERRAAANQADPDSLTPERHRGQRLPMLDEITSSRANVDDRDRTYDEQELDVPRDDEGFERSVESTSRIPADESRRERREREARQTERRTTDSQAVRDDEPLPQSGSRRGIFGAFMPRRESPGQVNERQEQARETRLADERDEAIPIRVERMEREPARATARPASVREERTPTPAERETIRHDATPRSRDSGGRPARHYLAVDAPVVDAPSIGHKTAARLSRVGIETVRDLLDADPNDVADQMATRGVDGETIARWQDQSRLMLTVPGLRGHDAQILVGCGYVNPRQMLSADAELIALQAEEYVSSPEGKRVLRDATAPEVSEVQQWLAWASSVSTSRAA